uniref:T6SS Phospholipase effector Tle1-like catalytic domain-containing protein n=1 Tax=Ditylum brightwellii TaxID=49249 RepID=A0A7S2EDU1_9STRA|mmetsp:Transcript_26251/g.39030  ORF Transcript_26251/g.39030 Transcript_26251/m.39030 type:complete len:419 (+) Transcript_26251:103-1359(+)
MNLKALILGAVITSATGFAFQPSPSHRSFETSLHAKKILLAFDGTGNNARDFAPSPDDDKSFTNVLKLHLHAGGSINGNVGNPFDDQISLYERGIGGKTYSELLSALRIAGGDLSKQTKPMRKRLEQIYEPGDQLYLLGFSRGSAAARNFAVELNQKGLRTKYGEKVQDPPIEFLGCFDTVSMQVKKRLIKILKARRKHLTTASTVLRENGKISPSIKKAVHILSLDDNRQWATPMCFPPVLMGDEERVHEVWVPGEHGDAGGNFYTKGLPDGACQHMKEFMEEAGLKFVEKAEDIKPECLHIKVWGEKDIQVKNEDLIINPDPSDKLHWNEAVQIPTDTYTPSYRPVYVAENDELKEGAKVKIHESVLLHMEAQKKEGKKYLVNPKLKDTDFVVVGSLGKELESETKRLAELLKSDY